MPRLKTAGRAGTGAARRASPGGAAAPFPTAAGILLGLGLGGFFDGIVLHQILQWHHMASSAGYPPDSLSNLELNTLLDGLFHATTYLLVAGGIALLWRDAHRGPARWASWRFVGTLLMGFGLFNLIEGVIGHHLLGLHHVNETIPRAQWIYWDLAFLIWGAAMLGGGWLLWRMQPHDRERGAGTAGGLRS